MKINKLIIRATAIGLLTTSVACTSDYMDINTNPYEATKEQMEADGYNISSAMVGMQGYIVPVDQNLFQFTDCLLGGSYGGYLADSNPGFINKYSTYNPQQHWIRVPFVDIIPKVFANQSQLEAATSAPIPLSVAMITKVAAIQRVVDIYGPIPYSKIGKDGSLTAAYDSQKDVYLKMFEELDQAIATLSAFQNSTFSPNADKVFDGSILKWIKYANSLKLRMAVRVVYADPALAKAKAEEAVANTIGTMTSNSDNAFIKVSKNPFKIVMYDYNGGDTRIGADISAYMNGYKDPRREQFFTQSTFGGGITNGYFGLRSGINIPTTATAQAYSNMNMKNESKLMLMNAAEVAFLKAEGAMRGWNMGGTAELFYNAGINLSFDQWGAANVNQYIADDTSMPSRYTDPMGAFSYNGATSSIKIKWDNAASSETQLERIITQKWIANFPLGLEAWAEFRRTGYPKLMEVVTNNSGGVIPSNGSARRLPYPSEEYTENRENVLAAISLLGGADNMATRVWWDSKN